MQVAMLKEGLEFNAESTMYPSRLRCYQDSKAILPLLSSTYFGLVLEGQAKVLKGNQAIPLQKGMFFAVTGVGSVEAQGKLLVIERLGYRGMDTYGGPLEDHGRLCYIDNCRSSILVAPPRLGDPVLNLLTFPPKVQQTMHIHPTIRMGVVVSGRGHCILADGRRIPLEPNMVFNILEAEPHCFHSAEEPMIILAYHPDSDVGPTDEHHPMLSRTYTKF